MKKERGITRMRKNSRSVLAGVALVALTLTGCSAATEAPEAEETSMVEESPTAQAGNIVDVAVGEGSFNILASGLELAGLIPTLQGEGPFTVFAPTDDAFAQLPEGVLDALLLPENVEILTAILTYHVVSGTVMAADVTAGDVATVEGSTISIDTSNGVVLNGTATVTATDITGTNGVIHAIDAVILPPGVDLSALTN